MGVFIVLLLSGERNFGVRLNKPYTVRVPMDIPIFTGTHADLLIIVRVYPPNNPTIMSYRCCTNSSQRAISDFSHCSIASSRSSSTVEWMQGYTGVLRLHSFAISQIAVDGRREQARAFTRSILYTLVPIQLSE
jgi:hypothetical protein